MKKIKIAYDPVTKLYSVQLDYNYANYSINGKRITNNGVIIFKNKPESIIYHSKKSEIISYINNETNEVISVEDFNNRMIEINSKRTYDDNIEEFVYNSIQDEVETLHYIRNVKPIYETKELEINVEYELIEYPVSEYAYIHPLFSLDINNIYETKCKYIPSMDIIYDICSKYGITKDRVSISTSGLEYLKIDDKYVNIPKLYSFYSIVGTYEECVNKYKKHVSDIDNFISIHLAKESNKKVDKESLGHLIKSLSNISNTLNNIEVKSKSYNSIKGVVNSINELIQTYKNLA